MFHGVGMNVHWLSARADLAYVAREHMRARLAGSSGHFRKGRVIKALQKWQVPELDTLTLTDIHYLQTSKCSFGPFVVSLTPTARLGLIAGVGVKMAAAEIFKYEASVLHVSCVAKVPPVGFYLFDGTLNFQKGLLFCLT